ncbi:MAG: tetratricopeptide repeat protein [bacterium]|nr:tetratricopeptide repeat protein [bacterium]
MNRFNIKLLSIIFIISLSVLYSDGVLFAQQDGDDIVIGKYRVFHSEIMGEDRTLLIHLPRNYETSNISYPVVFHLYGQQIHRNFGYSMNILETMSVDGRIPQMILVGVANTDRYRDNLVLNNEGSPAGADKFLDFFEKELIPFIESNYKTKDYRIFVGPQASAVFGLYTIMEKPQMFNTFILDSPFLNPTNSEYLMNRAQSYFTKERTLNNFMYIKYETDAREHILDYTARFKDRVDANTPKEFQYIIRKKETEGDFVKLQDIKEALNVIFSGYILPDDFVMNELKDIRDYYKKLSDKVGFEIEVPSMMLTFEGDKLIQERKYNEAIEMFNYDLEIYPHSLNSWLRLGETYRTLGDLEKAVTYYRGFLDIRNTDASFIENRLRQVERMIAGSVAYAIEKEINRSGIKAGKRKFNDLKINSETGIYFDEREFNLLGYKLLGAQKADDAVEIFKMCVELYPASANSYDSLGEAYMKAGDKDLAIKNYEKSLELNPENANAIEMLKRLKGGAGL